MHAPRDGGVVPCADGLGDDRIEAHEHAHPEDGHGKEIQVAEGHGGQCSGAEVPHHEGVHHAHEHHADLNDDDGHRKRQQRPQLVTGGEERRWRMGTGRKGRMRPVGFEPTTLSLEG